MANRWQNRAIVFSGAFRCSGVLWRRIGGGSQQAAQEHQERGEAYAARPMINPTLGTSGRGRVRGVLQHGGNSGINGGSSGKDGVNTLGDHAMVFSELRRVTCGVAVHKAVDNHCDVRITGAILWTRCGYERNLK
jgi:hypothetical protein